MTGLPGVTTTFILLLFLSPAVPPVPAVPGHDRVQTDRVGLSDTRLEELDAVWGEMTRTVEEGSFEEYAVLYHADAILVSGPTENSYPISQALSGWEQGFTDTKSGKTEATVEFIFTQRLGDETTAHETGMFHYTAKPSDGEGADNYVHFEALLIKKAGDWKMMMEYQKSSATAEDWDAAH
jgi:hypothetical protein